jgi:hypothetical protein
VSAADGQPAKYGFITIVDVPELGHAGGLLILSPEGRPIEFHCTAPVLENKTQKILYGQTYPVFLYCDQIGSALVEKSRSKPELLVTDRSELMPLAKRSSTPVVKLCQQIEADAEDSRNRSSFDINGETVETEIADLQQAQWAEDACRAFAKSLPLIEPFERIKLAIDEAGSATR